MRYFTLLLLLWTTPSVAQIAAPQITGVQPAQHAIGVTRTADIIVDFDTTISVTSVNNNSFRVFGRWSGPVDGSFTLQNSNQRIKFTPDRPFFSGERVTVMLSTDIKAPVQLLSQPIQQAWSWSFWVEADPVPLDLFPLDTLSTRFPSEGWVQSHTAYAGDLNEDGHSDISIVTGQAGDIRTFLNDGLGVYNNFTDLKLNNAASPMPIEGADFNNDEHIDVAVGSTGNSMVSVAHGNGSGTLNLSADYTSGNEIRGLDVLDVNQDTHPDILTANRFTNDVGVLINDGNGGFLSATFFDPGGTGEAAIAMGDMNNDGLQDVVIGAYGSEQLFVHLSDGNGGFLNSATLSAHGKPWMVATGDLNNDGFLDVAAANSDSNVVAVFFGDGAGQISSSQTYNVGAFPVAVALGDLDGDGDLDLISSNYSGANFTFLENLGAGSFGNPRTYGGISAGSYALFHDRNSDGDLDLTLVDETADVILTLDDDSTLAFIGIENQTINFGLHIYPNPISNNAYLEFNKPFSGILHIEIIDLTGRILCREEERVQPQTQTSINLGQLPNGIYFIRCLSDQFEHTQKIIIQK